MLVGFFVLEEEWSVKIDSRYPYEKVLLLVHRVA